MCRAYDSLATNPYCTALFGNTGQIHAQPDQGNANLNTSAKQHFALHVLSIYSLDRGVAEGVQNQYVSLHRAVQVRSFRALSPRKFLLARGAV
jgi:hypothetical protein